MKLSRHGVSIRKTHLEQWHGNAPVTSGASSTSWPIPERCDSSTIHGLVHPFFNGVTTLSGFVSPLSPIPLETSPRLPPLSPISRPPTPSDWHGHTLIFVGDSHTHISDSFKLGRYVSAQQSALSTWVSRSWSKCSCQCLNTWKTVAIVLILPKYHGRSFLTLPPMRITHPLPHLLPPGAFTPSRSSTTMNAIGCLVTPYFLWPVKTPLPWQWAMRPHTSR